MRQAYKCFACRMPVWAKLGPGGTRWVHVDGHDVCLPSYASPDFNRPVSEADVQVALDEVYPP